jgi:hypothetical protein
MPRGMSESVFRLSYDGDAIRDGEMDVADLAPALLGLAQLFKAAARVLDESAPAPTVRVKSTKEGCFEVWLALHVNDAALDALGFWDFLKTPDGQAAAALLSIFGFTGTVGATVIGIVKKLAGRRPSRVFGTTPGNVAIEVDGERIEVPDTVAMLALDVTVRIALERVIADPLEKDGIDVVAFGGTVADAARIEKSEGDYFRAPAASVDGQFESRHRKAFSIVTLSFRPGRKWRLSDGGATRSVTMSDKEFQARVDASQEAFAKGDILVCDVVERAQHTATGFRSEYEIVKVLEHRKPMFQAPLFTGPSDG